MLGRLAHSTCLVQDTGLLEFRDIADAESKNWLGKELGMTLRFPYG